MFSSLLGKRKKNKDNINIDVKGLISEISKYLKGKNEEDVLYQRSEKLMYMNILYPNKITLGNLKSVFNITHVNEIILKKNSKKKAVTIVIVLQNNKKTKTATSLRLHEEKLVPGRIKRSTYLTCDPIVTSEILDEFKGKKSISIDYYEDSLRLCMIEDI